MPYVERYMRAVYTISGQSPSFTFDVDFSYVVPSSNLSGSLAVTSATSGTVTFVNPVTLPTVGTLALASTTGGTLANSTTYYYRVGVRTRTHGP